MVVTRPHKEKGLLVLSISMFFCLLPERVNILIYF